MWRRDLLSSLTFALGLLTLMIAPALLHMLPLAAQVSDVIASPTPQPNPLSPVLVSAFTAFWSSVGLEWLKKQGWFTILSTDTTWLMQRVIGVVVALFAAGGLHWTYDAAIGTLTVTGLKDFSWDAAFQWSVQEYFYRGTVKPYAATRQG